MYILLLQVDLEEVKEVEEAKEVDDCYHLI